jgi:glycosyltransferase involved in cell wall biosynthesis
MERGMKVLFIAPQPFFRIRGTPINVRLVVRTLAEQGHEVDLLCYPFGDSVDIPGVRIIRSAGFPGIRDVKIGPSLAKFPLDGLLFLKAWGLCRRRRYKVIHAVEESVFFAVWLKKWFKTELIYDMDSMISDQLRTSGFVKWAWILRMVERMECWAARESAFVLTVCQSLSDGVEALAPGIRIVQIEDAPLQERYTEDEVGAQEIRAAHGLQDRQIVLYTGNLEAYQGVELLIRSAEEVVKTLPDTHFLIVGGSEKHLQQMKLVAAECGVECACTFTGTRPMEDMPGYMTAADVLVSPRTKGTNTALKIYTYMQAGKPIVATDLATHTQVLDDQVAVLVKPEPSFLAQGLVDVLSDSQRAKVLGAASAARVEQDYSWARFREKVRAAYALLG